MPDKKTMDQRTCNIIMCCKGHCMLPDGKDKDRLTAVAAYMSHECACPIEDYTGKLLETVMATALFDYMDYADKPSCELRRLFEYSGMGKEPSMSERIAGVFALTRIRGESRDGESDRLVYANGFTDRLIRQSRIDLGEKPAGKDGKDNE